MIKEKDEHAEELLAPGATGTRFLHVIPDEKFMDDAYAIFEEAAPGSHDYLILSEHAPLRYIRDFRPVQLDAWRALRRRVLDVLPDYEAVFVHFLNPAARQLLAAAPQHTRFVWIGWGADYYHLICNREQLLLKETRQCFARIARNRAPLDLLQKGMRFLHLVLKHPVRAAVQAKSRWRVRGVDAGQPGELLLLNRIRYFAPVLREDYESIMRANPGFQPQFLQWNYWTAGMGMGVLGGASVKSFPPRNILLGNSATPENNHLEAMRLIEGGVGNDRKIICPLSYGIPAYASIIEDEGERLFGRRFVPLRDFIDSTTYFELLRSCSVAAMNHVRQQAMGNIIMMLWMGSRVFLNHENPINRAMASIGVDVYDIRELPDYLRRDECRRPSPDCLADIRERLSHRFGREAVMRNTLAILARVAQ